MSKSKSAAVATKPQKTAKPTGKIDFAGLGLGTISDMMKAAPAPDSAGLREIPLDQITPDPDQPRKNYDPTKLAELADSIRAQGIIQPLVLRETETGFTIIAGERRWRAAKAAGLAAIPSIIRNDLTARAQMVENLQREDLSPYEIYRVIAAELDGGTSQKELAEAYGKGKSWISEFASVAKMPTELQDALREGRAGDIYALSELNRLHKRAPAEVEQLASSGAPITRHLVNQLAESLARAVTGGAGTAGGNDNGDGDGAAAPKPKKEPAAPTSPTNSPATAGVADNGEGLDIGGRGPSTLPGSGNPGAGQGDEYQPPQPLPNNLPVGIRVQYDGDTYWLRYDQQKQTGDKTLAMLATDAGLTLYAPLDELVIAAIYPHHSS